MVSVYRVLDKTKSLMDQKMELFQQLWHQFLEILVFVLNK